MPKRHLDLTDAEMMEADKIPKKTERSHEENQERAYIAASRRADRSIEARVQSARMASEIHRKRTGKGFKISEEIVTREEMYEEEDDDLPRHYRALAAHLHTSSEDMNNRLNAYITNQVAMRTFARHEEVNRMFSESFPNACHQQQQQHAPQARPDAHASFSQKSPLKTWPRPTGGSPRTRAPLPHHQNQHSRSRSLSLASSAHLVHPSLSSSSSSSASSRRPSAPAPSVSPVQLAPGAVDDRMSTPALTPGSESTETPRSYSPPALAARPQPYQSTTAASAATNMDSSPTMMHNYFDSGYLDPAFLDPAFLDQGMGAGDGLSQHQYQHQYQHQQSTSYGADNQPTNDAKLLADLDMANPLSGSWYGMPSDLLMNGGGSCGPSEAFDRAQITSSMGPAKGQHQYSFSTASDVAAAGFLAQQSLQCLQAQPQPQSQGLGLGLGHGSRIGTPGGGDGDAWDAWVNTEELGKLETEAC